MGLLGKVNHLGIFNARLEPGYLLKAVMALRLGGERVPRAVLSGTKIALAARAFAP
jgi:hypothetical protein